MNHRPFPGEDVADLHPVGAAIKDELLVETGSADRRRRGLVVVSFADPGFCLGQAGVRRQLGDITENALLEVGVDPKPAAAREDISVSTSASSIAR